MVAISPDALPEAPGARAARVCGILAVVLALTCVGIPIALVLGIVALVQQGKARRAALAGAGSFRPVTQTGLVTGIVGLVLPFLMLPVFAVTSAIAIPALLGQRERARDKALEAHWALVLQRGEAILGELWAQHPGQPVTGEEVVARLLADPQLAALRNPWDTQRPVLVPGERPDKGCIALSPGRDENGEGTTWWVHIRACFGKEGVREHDLRASFLDRAHPQDAAEGWKAEPQPADNPKE